jgi:hypothetical protein
MKKLLAIVLVVGSFVVVACGKKNEATTPDPRGGGEETGGMGGDTYGGDAYGGGGGYGGDAYGAPAP